MKKAYLLLVILVSIVIFSCDDEDVRPNVIKPSPYGPSTPPPAGPDSNNPVVRINTPAPNTTFTVIDIIALNVTITDDKGLKETRTYLIDLSSGKQNMISSYKAENQPGRNNLDLSGTEYFHRSVVGLPKSATTVSYKIVIEAEDKEQNVSKDSVSFNIHAPDLNKTEFVKASTKINLYHAMDWYGYTFPKDPEDALSLALLYMVDNDFDLHISEAQWIKFTADFDLKDEVWAKWDVNSDGSLNLDEFNQSIKKLNFYTEWNTNNKSGIDEHELAAGIFSRWDHDKNGALSRQEYEEKFFTYYISN